MVIAQAKHVPSNYRKIKPVLELVRGRTVADALVILDHTPRRARGPVIQLLKSARANAHHNHNYKPDSLVIAEIFVTNGMRLGRWRLRPRRSFGQRPPVPYQRHTCHLRVVLDGELRRRATAKPARPPVTEDKSSTEASHGSKS